MDNALLFFYLGIVFIQSFFILYQYIISRRLEFIYYLAYVVFITLLISFHWMPEWGDQLKLVTPEGQFFLARATLLSALAFYYGFGRHFCDMVNLHVAQNKFQLRLEQGMIIFSIFDLVTCLIYRDYFFPDIIVKMFFVLLMLYSIYIVWFLATRKRILNSILVTGSSFLLIGGIIYAIEYVRTDNSLPGSYYMQFYIYGVILEFMFLNFGLIYKSKLVQEEHTRILKEKQFQFQTQRNQLVDDLQDEVGGGLSLIRITSELLNSTSMTEEQKQTHLSKIINATEKVSEEMKSISWSLNTGNDTVEHTVEYIAQHAKINFDKLDISFKFSNHVASENPIYINGLSRKNLVSICKLLFEQKSYDQSVTNVFLHIQKQQDVLVIRISDNGNEQLASENFKHIHLMTHKLISEINGSITIEHHNGSIITIICPIVA